MYLFVFFVQTLNSYPDEPGPAQGPSQLKGSLPPLLPLLFGPQALSFWKAARNYCD